ncbi:hypothetical protein RB195_011709 [Necator americanus]|uniref:C2H2-type domain-containing protein n=1 Tax=Necator americanus TaxID=51031 RepID=A0ABR1D500_NECAM
MKKVAVKEENSSETTRRTDLWRSNNTCVICQDHCPTREDKDKHENQTKHKRKFLIYEFFAKEIPNFQPFSGPSALVKRYTGCGEQVVGLECLHELHFSFSSIPWWACSICYESGALLEQADKHLTSMNHITTYLDEFHSSKTAALQMDGDRMKVFEEIRRLCDEIVAEQGGELLPPECMIMDAKVTEKEAMMKLALDVERLKPSYRIHTDCTDEAHPRKILQCLICRQLIAVNDELLKRIWGIHELSPTHRHAVAINQFLEQFDVEYILDGDVPAPEGPLKWKTENECNYGPLCGVKFLVTFRKRKFCQLCCCELDSVEQHFSSESHIMQFLTISSPVEMFRVSQFACQSRMKKVLEIISNPKFQFENEQSRKVHADWFPKNIEVVLKPESHHFPTLMPPLVPLGIDSSCLFCTVCWLAVSVDKGVQDEGEAAWNSHCAKPSHFEFAIRRACFGFDDAFFVPMSSNVPKAQWNLHGKWTEMKENNKETWIQTQSDVGLEFVVDDQENQEVVCTLCAQWFPRGMDQQINNHIRSYQHLNHYLHVTNRNLLSMVMVQKTEKASRELVLEWLKRSVHNDMDEMRVYSPEMAMRMRQWGSIPIRKVDVISYDPTHRPVIECVMGLVDKLADDGAENIEMPIKEALSAAGIKIHAIKQRNGNIERILCRCTQCEMAFSTPIESIIKSVWDCHLASEQHFGRFRAFMAAKLDMLGFSEATSSYTVKAFSQEDPSRKVTWQWNSKEKAHEFVLNVIGMEDLVERRSNETDGPHPPDFFCRLCAVVIPRRSAALEAHVRSAKHILCYVHKYHPLTIMELDLLPKEGGKEMRKLLAQLLKDCRLKEQYCIPVYDPIGEQERKGIVAMQKAKDQERQRQLAEARKKAKEERKKKDEERRKQRELEAEKEKLRAAERARKEKEARERAQQLAQEKAHVKRLLEEAARKAAEEKKGKEAKEKAQEEADRKKRQEELRSLLDREKARLKSLKEKEATQRRLFVEKQELEKKMRVLQERAAMQNQPSPLVQNQVPPRNGPSSYPNIPEPQLVTPHTRTPLIGLVNVSPEPYRHSLLGPGPALIQGEPHHSLPPPTRPYNGSPFLRETMEAVGPKPLFPQFVPVADQVPIYKGLEDAERASRLKPKSPTPEKPEVRMRPSLRDRKIDPYLSSAKIIQTREQLVDFIWRQGAERIPANELPVLFNEKAAEIEGALGVDCLYEVVCADCSDLDTLYCSMCGVWTTPNEMFKHLETVEHKLAYLFRNYKMYHQTVVSETNALVREAMLSQFAIQIWKMEKPPGQVSNRLRSLLDRSTIERIWPEHVDVLDHSWKESGKSVGRVEVPPPISKEAWCFATDKDKNTKDKKTKEENRINEEKKIKEEKKIREEKKIKEEKKEEKGPKIKTENIDSRSKRKDESKEDKEKEKRESASSVNSKKPGKPSSSSKPHESRKFSSPDRKRRRTKSPEKRSSRDDKHSYGRSSSPSRRGRSSSRSRRDRSSSRSKRDRHRGSSKDRSRRTRSRSRSGSLHHSRRKRSRSRSRSRGRGSSRTGKAMTWEETAAAFLAKLGDSKAAAEIFSFSNEKEKKAAPPKSLVNDKIKQLRNLAKPGQAPRSVENMEKDRGKLLESSDSDEKVQMRKLLGVLITMQQEAERNSNLDESIIDRLYREDGQSTSKPSIDLQSYGISARPEPTVKQQASSIFGGADSKEIHQASSSSGPSEQQLSKKDRAALRRQRLLEEAERLRREAEQEDDEDDDDDWDCLAEVINGPAHPIKESAGEQFCARSQEKQSEQKPVELDKYKKRRSDDKGCSGDQRITEREKSRDRDRDRRYDDKAKSHERRSDSRGKSHDRRSYEKEKDSNKTGDSKKSGNMRDEAGLDPVTAGQKISHQTPLLPDGKPSRKEKQGEKGERNSAMTAAKGSARHSSPEKDKSGVKLSKKERKALARERALGRSMGKPNTWPQPVPQPLLGLSLDPPPKLEQQLPPQQEQLYQQQPPNHYHMSNEPVYPPVYANQYSTMCMNQPPQQFQNPQYYQRQQFIGQPYYGEPQMQQQFYGQPPFY